MLTASVWSGCFVKGRSVAGPHPTQGLRQAHASCGGPVPAPAQEWAAAWGKNRVRQPASLHHEAQAGNPQQANRQHWVLFTTFVDEGKATVQLKEPPVDICLSKANPGSLKIFLSAMRLAHRGCNVDTPLSTLKPGKTSEFEKSRSKMVITSKKNYPLSKSLPFFLEHLQASHCRPVQLMCLCSAWKTLRI